MFGARIRQVRRALGYTQHQVAGLLGVDQSTYSRWERDTSRLSQEELERIASVLRVRAETLFGRERLKVAVMTADTQDRILRLEHQLVERDLEIKQLKDLLHRAQTDERQARTASIPDGARRKPSR